MTDRWHDGRMMAFDLETTGVDLDESRIVTACVALVGGGLDTHVTNWLVNPGIAIPDEAANVHGITTDRARAAGVEASVAVTEIVSALEALYLAIPPEPTPLIACNARFDLPILDREARRHGITPLGERVDLRVVDPLVIDKHIHRYRRGSRKLDALCAHYGVRLDQAHTADADAIAAARAAWAIAERGEIVRRERYAHEAQEAADLRAEWATVRYDLDALHEAQERWAADQAVSLQQYFRDQGKPDVVEQAWPVVPFATERAEAA